MLNKIKVFAQNARKKLVAGMTAIGAIGVATAASAAPATGDANLDSILTEMEGGFTIAQSGFTYLALAAIPVTIIVVLFFWLRGKFKQSVSGA